MEKERLEDMETKLAKQFLNREDTRLRAYICSPLSADTDEEMLENMYQARRYMCYAAEHLNMLARAPHAYLPMLLCDRIPNERALALKFDMELLDESDVILVCGEKISSGMRAEIIRAVHIRSVIMTFSDSMYRQVQKIVTEESGDISLLECDASHKFLTGTEAGTEHRITESEYRGILEAKEQLCAYCISDKCSCCQVTLIEDEARNEALRAGIISED